jgi:protoporphyrinogen oxidase
MFSCTYLILGAGPSGLALAHALLAHGVPGAEIRVLERESEVGGLCRSVTVDGAPLDIGGGHFLDVRRKEVLEFLFRFMPSEEWNTHQRVARIRFRGGEVDHPLEANLWQLGREEQAEYLESMARAGSVRGAPRPEGFEAWVRWKLGDRIADEYLLPYNRKLWSVDLEQLGTHWLHKLPDVSFRDSLRSCLEGRPFGTLPAHGTFLYPRAHGYGEVWRRMGEALGDCLVTGCPVTGIDLERRTVNGRFRAGTIITTIPWTDWPTIASLPPAVAARVAELGHVAIDVDYHPASAPTAAHWIYDPSPEVAHHRSLLRHNFCPGAHGHWTETNARRSGPATGFRHHNALAYPLATRGTPAAIAAVLAWASRHGIIGAGRWGRWEHVNSDVAVAEALALAATLVAGARR